MRFISFSKKRTYICILVCCPLNVGLTESYCLEVSEVDREQNNRMILSSLLVCLGGHTHFSLCWRHAQETCENSCIQFWCTFMHVLSLQEIYTRKSFCEKACQTCKLTFCKYVELLIVCQSRGRNQRLCVCLVCLCTYVDVCRVVWWTWAVQVCRHLSLPLRLPLRPLHL